MKKVLLVCILLNHFLSFSQKSVQFSDPLPFGSNSQLTTEKIHFGKYKSSDSEVTYVIDEKGISIVTLAIASITREQVRESSKLQVRGDYLFGIKTNDSVPCVLEGENYYYGIESKLMIAGEGSLNTFTKITANKYIINFHEGSYFEPSLVIFTGGKMTIIHSDLAYQSLFSSILQIKTITRYGSAVAILAPTFEQWEQLEKALFNGRKLIYTKE
ncbi:hypothetical protein [Fluviicola taffensis]|uniref:Uncharacterized protein n=1 Tax=Fluviicola taffensis (strain DSM 16823 / NCIMB 13979 / RW262) TaxID=755732 RepID=F2IED2_FLUTR|nr:hypothetical protein [Fluviicola taffensis]AEA43456.1 hypothetical protein Fluta_1462 [Fluviicola taffensis DSM 16823]